MAFMETQGVKAKPVREFRKGNGAGNPAGISCGEQEWVASVVFGDMT